MKGSSGSKAQTCACRTPNRRKRWGFPVFQDLALVNRRDIAQNLYLGQELRKMGFVIDRKQMFARSAGLLRNLRGERTRCGCTPRWATFPAANTRLLRSQEQYPGGPSHAARRANCGAQGARGQEGLRRGDEVAGRWPTRYCS